MLHETVDFSGWVYSPEGPVPGASVIVLPDLLSAPSGSAGTRATTDVDGSFSFEARSNVRVLAFLVEAPGYATRILRRAVDPNRPLMVDVDADGGDLFLELPPRAMNFVLLHDSTVIPLALLRGLAQGRVTGKLKLPYVGSGTYTWCVGSSRLQQALMQRAALPAESCSAGFLAPGGSLTLSAPGEGAL